MQKLLALLSSFSNLQLFCGRFQRNIFPHVCHGGNQQQSATCECSKKRLDIAYLKFAGTFSA